MLPYFNHRANFKNIKKVPTVPPVPTPPPVVTPAPPVPTPPPVPAPPVVPAPPICPPAQIIYPPIQPVCPPIQPVYPIMQPMCPGMMMPMIPAMLPMGYIDDMDGMDGMGFPTAMTTSDPPPIISNNPPATAVSLFKELTGYPNYGNPSGNADILYTGTRGTWTFDIPPYLFVPGNQRAQLIIRAVLDDHYNIPVSQYSATISINGVVVHNGPLPLDHGRPGGTMFTNWGNLLFVVATFRRNNIITIVNTSRTGANDWIALDWMEMRLVPR